MPLKILSLSLVSLLVVDYAVPDEGILNNDGCHRDLMTGVYHCHHAGEPPTFPDPWGRPDEPSVEQNRESKGAKSWKNLDSLGYASVGLFGEVGVLGEMDFQGVDQTCRINGNSNTEADTCNNPAKLMDFGAYGEINIGLFDTETYSFFVGTEIGSALTWGGKFFNCRADAMDWDICDSDSNRARGSIGKLKGYSYGDIKLGIAGLAANDQAILFDLLPGDFGFIYLLAGMTQYSSEWGSLRKSEYGIGLDVHYSKHFSAGVKFTDKRFRISLRGHF